jgi:hypothetical protein
MISEKLHSKSSILQCLGNNFILFYATFYLLSNFPLGRKARMGVYKDIKRA